MSDDKEGASVAKDSSMTDTPATSDLFSDSIPQRACHLCKNAYGAALSVRADFWASISPKGPEHSDDACPNCVVEKISDLQRYGVIRVALSANAEIVDAVARGRREGWIAAFNKLEEVGGSFLPMSTLLEWLEKDPNGTITFASGFNQTIKECFKEYSEEFYRRIEQLRQDAPPGGFEDEVIRDSAAATEGRA